MLTALLLAQSASARIWTDNTGKFRIDAKLVAVRDGKVYLEKSDGQVLSVPLDKLSSDDIKHLNTLPGVKDKLGATPGTPAKSTTSSTPPAPVSFVEIKVDDPNKAGEIRNFGNMRWGVKSLAFSPNAGWLAVGKMDRALMLFDVNKRERLAFHEKLEGLDQVTALAWTPDGKKLLSGGYRGRIQVWDVSSTGQMKEANRFVGHSEEIRSITISKDGGYVLSGSKEKKVRYWNLKTGKEEFAIDGFAGPVKATFITPSRKQGLASDGQTLVLLDLTTGKVVQTAKLSRSYHAQFVAFSGDGTRVAVQDSYNVLVWNTQTGKKLPTLTEREIQWSGTFSPNGKHFLSGGRGKTNLWDVATGKKLYEFDSAGKILYVQNLAYSPDNKHFAAIPGSAGQQLQVFRTPKETH